MRTGFVCAALVAAIEGLSVLVCEKTGQLGGTAASSAGTVWVPGSSQSQRAGLADPLLSAHFVYDHGRLPHAAPPPSVGRSGHS